jgi:predicted DNA-binding transcriptional regulator AlpA
MDILTEEQVRARKLAGASSGTLHALMNDEEDPFPQPISISPRLRAWVEHEVDQWLERRRLRRDADAQRRADIKRRMPHARDAVGVAVANRRRRAGKTGAAGDAAAG